MKRVREALAVGVQLVFVPLLRPVEGNYALLFVPMHLV